MLQLSKNYTKQVNDDKLLKFITSYDIPLYINELIFTIGHKQLILAS